MIHKFPYQEFPPLEIPDDQIADVCALQRGPATADDVDIVREALNAPVGCGRLREKADIVISDAYPADLDFWQALKGLNAACGAVTDGGTVILATPCPEGTSAQHPELTTVGYIPVERTRRMVAEGTIDKAIAANLVLGRRLLDRARAILVTKGISERDTRAMGFGWAPDPATALQQAIARHGRSATINVLSKAAAMICVSNTT